MKPALTMQSATGLLAVSVAGGSALAAIRVSGKPHPPISLAMLHGFLPATVLTLLIHVNSTVGKNWSYAK